MDDFADAPVSFFLTGAEESPGGGAGGPPGGHEEVPPGARRQDERPQGAEGAGTREHAQGEGQVRRLGVL